MTFADWVMVIPFIVLTISAIKFGVFRFPAHSKNAVILVLVGITALAVLLMADLLGTYVLPSTLPETESTWAFAYTLSILYWLVVFVAYLLIGIGLLRMAQLIGSYESTLDQSESRYKKIVEDQTDLIVRWDFEGIRTWMNDAYCEYFEQPREELIGTSFFPLLSEKVRNENLERFKTLTPESPSVMGENTFTMSDGSERWQEWTHHVIFDKDGKRVECQSVGRDITMRKMAEFALKSSETRYRNLVENTSDWVWQSNLKAGFTYTNQQIIALLGYNPEELSLMSARELYDPEEVDDIFSRFASLAENKEGWQHWLMRMRHKDGNYKFVDSSAIPMIDSSGKITGFSGIDRDVTFNTLLAEASTNLLSANIGSMQIDEALGKFAEYFRVDRFELWWRDQAGTASTLTYSWTKAGKVASASEVRLSEMPSVVSQFQENKVVRVTDTRELPAEFLREALNAGMSISRAFALFPLTSNEGQRRLGSGRVAVYESARDWTDREINELQLAFNLIATAEARLRSESELQDRERFHKLVASVSTELLKVSVDDLSLTNALRQFATHFEVGGLSCWRFDKVNKLASQSCNWHQEGVDPGPAVFEFGSLPQYEGPVLAGEVVRVSDTKSLYTETSAEMELSESMGITASLSVPLELGLQQDYVGCGVALVFDGVREWTDQEVEDLQLAFNVITIAQARMQSEGELQGRERFQAFFAEISTRLLDAHHKDVGEQIVICLEKIARHYGLDRGSLWSFDKSDTQTRRKHEWSIQSKDHPQLEDSFALDSIPWASARMLSGKDCKFNTIEDVPIDETKDREAFQKQQVKSLLALPISFENRKIGAIVFSTFVEEHSWSEKEVSEIRLLAEVLMNALMRAESTRTIQERERDLNRSEELACVGSYSLHPEAGMSQWPLTGKFIVSQELYKLLNITAKEPAFEDFISRIHDEDRECVLNSLSELIRAGTTLQQEYRLIGSSGKTIHIQDRTEVDRVGKDGEVSKLFGTLKDISDRVLRENELRAALKEIETLKENLEEEAVALRDEIKSAHGFDRIIGGSEALERCLMLVNKVAPTDATVMLLGETGSGKELIAHAIHEQSARKSKRMVSVNCAALPESLIESELFGHEKGAFTGAGSARKGRFELADGGTLFLDEIGEMPLPLQSKLLRAIQEGEFERLGGSKTLKVNVRIVAATNRQLKASVDDGEFRADLYYRISNFPIDVPSLSERKEDIPMLAEHFVRKFAPDLGRDIKAISSSMMQHLTQRAWPGNVRELEGFIQNALITNEGDVLTLGVQNDGAEQLVSEHGELLNAETATLSSIEHRHIINILNQTSWMISGDKGAAKILGVPPSTLRSRMKKLGIEHPDKDSASE